MLSSMPKYFFSENEGFFHSIFKWKSQNQIRKAWREKWESEFSEEENIEKIQKRKKERQRKKRIGGIFGLIKWLKSFEN